MFGLNTKPDPGGLARSDKKKPLPAARGEVWIVSAASRPASPLRREAGRAPEPIVRQWLPGIEQDRPVLLDDLAASTQVSTLLALL